MRVEQPRLAADRSTRRSATAVGYPIASTSGSLGLIGRIVTLGEPPVADALLIESGDQLLTAEQGLHAVTRDAAYALGDETRRGHLAPGALGDDTVLSGDVLSATPDEIRDMSVVATIVGGIPVLCPDPGTCDRLGD